MIALLTNDDGIEADGLKALEEIAADYFESVWLVAPADQMSQIGHRVTTDAPIRIEQKGERSFAVPSRRCDGTQRSREHRAIVYRGHWW